MKTADASDTHIRLADPDASGEKEIVKQRIDRSTWISASRLLSSVCVVEVRMSLVDTLLAPPPATSKGLNINLSGCMFFVSERGDDGKFQSDGTVDILAQS